MKFCEFILIDLPMQAHIVYKNGTYLSERSVEGLFVALYGVFDFYVEVYYRCATSEIIKFISFHNDVLLAPYLQKISLNDLFVGVTHQEGYN